MKQMNRYITVFGLLVLLGFYSCKLEETNINPNNATDASVGFILPVAQANLVWAISDYTAQTTSVLLQQITGVLLNWRGVTDYAYLPRFFDEPWNQKFYAGSMKDLNTIIDKSTEAGATHYRGIARIQMAILLGYAVDFWGDVPFSTAFNLEAHPQPTFDSGEQLYQRVQQLLDEGIADLQATSTTSPSRNDLFYPAATEAAWRTNSAPRWIKAARSLKARYHNHLSKVNPTQSATDALAALAAGGFTSNADDLRMVLNSAASASRDEAGPWFGFLEGTFGQNNISVAQEFIDRLKNRVAPGVDDPRLRFYVTNNIGQPNPDGNYRGTPYGALAPTPNASRIGPYIYAPNAPTNIITFTEVKFIEAEAHLRLSNFAQAAAAHNAAVKSSILRVTGAANPAYEARFASETAATMQVDGLRKIFTEKHLALYLEAESWTDWRRSIPAGAAGTVSGIPNLVPAATNETNGVFPRRFLYPQSELVNNSGNVPNRSLTDRVFWDR